MITFAIYKKNMKIGDKVRFLNATGGGIVKRFQGKDIVLVEEEDGFETPVLLRECVVIDPVQAVGAKPVAPEVKEIKESKRFEEIKKIQTITEIAGKDKLNVYLAFLPMDIKNIGKCNYETFLVNDSNYFLFFNYMNRENNTWKSRCRNVIEPNTQLFIEEFTKEDLNDLEHICVQFIAYKEDKPYTLKNAQSVEIRLDGVKFYKIHSFRENDFFEDDALVYPVVTNDVPAREILVSAADIQEAMNQKIRVDRPNRQPVQQPKDTGKTIVEVDLHINELLDTTAGMSNTDIINVQLSKFRETMEQYKSKKGQKIAFIHGKGEGVLRNAIIQELKTKYKNCPYQDASFKEYGFGATMVTIK